MADAIICVGMEEDKFRRLAQENFVPLLSVDGKINDELFFQIYQNFENVIQKGEEAFGKDNFTIALVDMYNQTLKDEIAALYDKIVFLEDYDPEKFPKGNVVTVHSSLKNLNMGNSDILVVPANTQARVDAILECFNMATERVQVTSHTVRVK